MKVYVVVEEYYDYWCPQDNEGSWSDIYTFKTEEEANKFIKEKNKTREEDNKCYILIEKDMGL